MIVYLKTLEWTVGNIVVLTKVTAKNKFNSLNNFHSNNDCFPKYKQTWIIMCTSSWLGYKTFGKGSKPDTKLWNMSRIIILSDVFAKQKIFYLISLYEFL